MTTTIVISKGMLLGPKCWIDRPWSFEDRQLLVENIKWRVELLNPQITTLVEFGQDCTGIDVQGVDPDTAEAILQIACRSIETHQFR